MNAVYLGGRKVIIERRSLCWLSKTFRFRSHEGSCHRHTFVEQPQRYDRRLRMLKRLFAGKVTEQPAVKKLK